MISVERLQKLLPENIRIGRVQQTPHNWGFSLLICGSWTAPIRNLHDVVFDAVMTCFNMKDFTVADRQCWRVAGAFQTLFYLVEGEL